MRTILISLAILGAILIAHRVRHARFNADMQTGLEIKRADLRSARAAEKHRRKVEIALAKAGALDHEDLFR